MDTDIAGDDRQDLVTGKYQLGLGAQQAGVFRGVASANNDAPLVASNGQLVAIPQAYDPLL
ncbi:MAG: hypothetical protein AAF648_15440 [Pseudomonadota bacterium]